MCPLPDRDLQKFSKFSNTDFVVRASNPPSISPAAISSKLPSWAVWPRLHRGAMLQVLPELAKIKFKNLVT